VAASLLASPPLFARRRQVTEQHVPATPEGAP